MYACRVRAFVRPPNVTATAIMIMMHSKGDGTLLLSVPGHMRKGGADQRGS
jgi:hypothetical protein